MGKWECFTSEYETLPPVEQIERDREDDSSGPAELVEAGDPLEAAEKFAEMLHYDNYSWDSILVKVPSGNYLMFKVDVHLSFVGRLYEGKEEADHG